MGSPSDDRSTRLRVWFLTTMPALTACVALVTWLSRDLAWVYSGAGVLWSFGCFGAFLFSSEPLGPSLRVQADWQRRGTPAITRSLGPGVLRACVLLLLLTAGSLVANAGLGVIKAKTYADRDAVLAFHGYALAFFGFVVGFTAWARARATSAGTPRLLLATALFFAFVGPWIAMAVAGIITSQHDRAMLMASPSPSFAVTGVRVRTRLAAEHSARAALQQAFEAEEAAHRASPAEPINEV